MQLRSLVLLALGALTSGCVWAGWGTFPQASGDGVEGYAAYLKREQLEPYAKGKHPYPLNEPIANGDLTTVVTTPELTLFVELEGYSPTVSFWGIGVPIVPMPVGLMRGDQRLRITVRVAKAAEGALLQAHSLRVRTSAGEVEPISFYLYRRKASPQANPSEAIAVQSHDRLDYNFDLVAPHEPFTVQIEGLPGVPFQPRTVWDAGLMDLN